MIRNVKILIFMTFRVEICRSNPTMLRKIRLLFSKAVPSALLMSLEWEL